MKQSIERYCFIAPSDDPVKVKFNVDKMIVAGADFKLFNETGTKVIEHWKMTAEDKSFATKRLRTSVEELHLKKMSWHILCCSLSANVFSGVVGIEIIQEDKICSMTIPAEKTLSNIPPCKLNIPDSYNGSLTFINIK